MIYTPCVGMCTKGGTHCQGCGRSHTEIAEIKKLVIQVVEFATKMDYENHEDFTKAIANSIGKKLAINQCK